MILLEAESRPFQPPAGLLRLDRRHPLARGLTFAALANEDGNRLIDLLTAASGTFGGTTIPTRSRRAPGRAVLGSTATTSNTGYVDFGTKCTATAKPGCGGIPASWVFYVLRDTGAATGNGLAYRNDGNTVNTGWMVGATSAGTGVGLSVVYSIGTFRAYAAALPTVGVPTMVVVTYDGSTTGAGLRVYYNGVSQTITNQATANGTPGTSNAGNSLRLLSGNFDSRVNATGWNLLACYMYDRVLSAVEARALAAEPYAIIARDSARHRLAGVFSYTGVGGADAGGSAPLAFTHVFTGVGGATSGGTGFLLRFEHTGVGGAVSGGAAPLAFTHALVGIGGAVSGGEAPFVWAPAFVDRFDIQRLAESLFVDSFDIVVPPLYGATFEDRFDVLPVAVGDFVDSFDVIPAGLEDSAFGEIQRPAGQAVHA